MEYKVLKPRQALNKAFMRVKPNRSDMERFKANLRVLMDRIDLHESEEFHKNLLSDFLKKTGYDPHHYINTKGRNDLVIHNGNSARTPVGVIIETKNPSNQNEMLQVDRINVKALQELLLYYLRERITNNNLELRYLVATNVYEWFIFDAQVFEQCFARNKELVRVFKGFDDGRLAGTKTEHFYKEVAPLYINEALPHLSFTYINLRDYRKQLRDTDKENDTKLIPLVKVLSPEHLLKLPFSNDSNTLDKGFYTELLHIIGLTEHKEKGKKLIGRKPEGERDNGSLLENAINQLDSLDKISQLNNPKHFGANKQERLFNVALELAITWTNRVLFLKLLEAQLVSYHKGDRDYAFLNMEKVGNYDGLNELFFQVLARKPEERSAEMQQLFGKVPYLNSSLFEPSGIEHVGLMISMIRDRVLPIHPATVLRDRNGKKRTGELDALEYFFAFLDAYDFTSEGAEEIQEDNKTLINASVLGLIFEKINGYKDGSFFTPGFITMYMSRETIRRTVVQKFNAEKDWKCETIDQLADRIDDNGEANRIINSLRICDPAVGSGHFLVSALNEIIAIKSELDVLCDRDGRRLKNYHVEVVNDELIVTDEDGDFFEYRPKLPESQRVQEALFHEKEAIIENCLFGVDINHNSVKICRLRLWIELLKSAYYKGEDELETLPNIDINIKCGNSLIHRFELDADLKQALKKGKWSIDGYRIAVMNYRNAESKQQKRSMEQLIDEIKGSFEAEFHDNHPVVRQWKKLRGQLFDLTQQPQLFDLNKSEMAAWNKKVKKVSANIEKAEADVEAIKSNKIYEDAFEWRFEFPEVLDNDGNFIGFDAVIGNPPYIRQEAFADAKSYLKQAYNTFTGAADLYVYFIEQGMSILRQGGVFSFITPNKWMRAGYGKPLRSFIKQHRINAILDFGDLPVFEEATTYPCILSLDKSDPQPVFPATNIATLDYPAGLPAYVEENKKEVACDGLQDGGWTLTDSRNQTLLEKIRQAGTPLGEYVDGKFYYGIKTGFNDAFVIDRDTRDRLVAEDPNCEAIIKPFLRGRDVKRWCAQPQDLWLINTHNGYGDTPAIDINDYPIIKAHLDEVERKRATGELGEKAQNSKGLFERTDQGKTPYNLRNCVYVPEFEQPKIIIPAITNDVEYALDEDGYFSNDKTSICVSAQPHFLLGILNSSVGWWFIRQIASTKQNGYYEFKPMYVSQIPIPAVTSEQQAEIEALVEQILTQKKENPNADVSTFEAEIDQMVYKLYDLTEEEVAIVESAGFAPKMTKPLLQDKVIADLEKTKSYFSIDEVKSALEKETGEPVPDSTVKTYLSKFMADGTVYDAGKGWYSKIAELLMLSTEPLEPIVKLLKKNYPLLEVSCWSTEQINPFMHHLLARFTTFVYADEDAMEVVGDALSDAGYNVLVNPRKPDVEQYYTKMDSPIVIRRSLSKEPPATNGMAPPEKLLVDLLHENQNLNIMEGVEAEDVVKKAVSSGRVNMAALQSYAKRREMTLCV